MNRDQKVFGLVGVLAGLAAGEFFPDLFVDGPDSIGPLRHLIALKFSFLAGLAGLVLGYLLDKIDK